MIRKLTFQAGAALAIVFASRYGVDASAGTGGFISFWPASGFAIAAIVLGGRELMVGIAGGALVAAFVSNQPAGWGFITGSALAAEALIGSEIMRRIRAGGEKRGQLNEFLAPLLTAACAPGVAVLIETLAGWYRGTPADGEALLWGITAWGGRFLGIFFVVPAVLAAARLVRSEGGSVRDHSVTALGAVWLAFALVWGVTRHAMQGDVVTSALLVWTIIGLAGMVVFQAGLMFRLHASARSSDTLVSQQRNQLAASQRENAILAGVARNSACAVILTDPQGLITWVNPGFELLTGYTLDECKGRKPGVLLQGPETDPSVRVFMGARIRAGQGFRTEVINYTKSGQAYWLDIECQPTHGPDGELLGFMAIEVDITQKMQLLRRVEEDRRRLAVLLSSSPGIVWEADPRTLCFTYVSERAATLLGYPLESWTSDPSFWTSHLHPDDRERTVSFCLAATQRGEDHTFDYRMIAADGRTVWVRDIAVVRREKGQVVSLTGVLVDITDSKVAEERLALAEARWRFALEGAGDGVWDWEMDSGVVHYSDRWKQMLGFEPHGIQDSLVEWERLTHPADRQKAMEGVRRHAEGKTEQNVVEQRMRCKDGSWKWILARGRIIERSPDGRPKRMIGTHSDIDHVVRSRLQNKELRENLALALRAARLGMWRFDAASGKSTWDETMQRLFGLVPQPGDYSPAPELISARVHPDDRHRFEAFREDPGSDQEQSSEYRLILPGGELRYIERQWLVSERSADGPMRIVGVDRDVTERQKAELEVLRQRDRLRFALSTGRMVWWEWNIVTGALHIDPCGAPCILGYEQPQLARETIHSWREKIHPDDRTGVDRKVQAVLADPAQAWICEYRWQNPTGEYLWVRDLGKVTHVDREGRPRLMTGVTQEIHEVRLEQERQRQLEKRLLQSKKLETIGQFTGGIAHDFNNLLTGINGNLQLALMDLPTNHPSAPFLDVAHRGCMRGKEMLDRLLRMTLGESASKMGLLDLGVVIRDCAPLIKAALPWEVNLKLELEPCRPVVCDDGQIIQMLMNLCINSGHAIMPGTGRVSIRLCECSAADAPKREELAAAEHYAVIAVSDDGRGMDRATAARIFEPYFTTRSAGVGTGLGLAVVHSIVVGHRGCISVQSEPGKGTTFTIVLPLGPAGRTEKAAEPSQVGRIRPAPQPGKLVLVDDDESIQLSLGAALRTSGHQVDCYKRNEDVLERIRGNGIDFDLLIVDLNMHGLGGDDLVRLLRSEGRNVPFIVISAHLAPRREALDLLAPLAVIEKPIDLVAFTTLVGLVTQELYRAR